MTQHRFADRAVERALANLGTSIFSTPPGTRDEEILVRLRFLAQARRIWDAAGEADRPLVRRDLARLACSLLTDGGITPDGCDDSCFRYVDAEVIGATSARGS